MPTCDRVRRPFLARLLAGLLALLPLASSASPDERVFIGFITDTECGPDHRPMLAKGDMGRDDHECTLACVKKGATFGFVDAQRKFYQLDDQTAPIPLAGQRVCIEGRIEGDTIFVKSIEAAD